MFAAAAVSVATTTAIVVSLAVETFSFFSEVPIGDYLFGTKWTPLLREQQQSFGVLALIWGTIYYTLIALIVAMPLGLLCAVYLAEYAPRRVAKVVKPVLEVLAGVPTIVFGFFALTFFTPEILRGALDIQVGQFNALSAGLIMGLLVLPTIASVGEDAMTSVPASLREGAFGLGRLRSCRPRCGSSSQPRCRASSPRSSSAPRGRSARRSSCSSRAARRPQLGLDPRESYQSMAAFIASVATGDAPTGSIEYKTIFVVGFTLFVMTLVLNLASIGLVRSFRQVYE